MINEYGINIFQSLNKLTILITLLNQRFLNLIF